MAKRIWWPWRCKCCPPPPPCTQPCCPGQTLVRHPDGTCTCEPRLICPDGSEITPPSCFPCRPECPEFCPDGTKPIFPFPQCCPYPPQIPVNCSACCPIGDDSASCTPSQLLISIPDATPNSNPLARNCPSEDVDRCEAGRFVRYRGARGCAAGGSYYLTCKRPLYYRAESQLTPEGCAANLLEQLLSGGQGVSECCSWSFCKYRIQQGVLVGQFGCPPGPPDCPNVGSFDFNCWDYAFFIGVKLLQHTNGEYFFSVAIGIAGGCAGARGECIEIPRPGLPPLLFDTGGAVMLVGASATEPRPLNCFAARTIPLTHYSGGFLTTPAGVAPAANIPQLPLTPAYEQLCDVGFRQVPSCVFPAGLSVTIQGVS